MSVRFSGFFSVSSLILIRSKSLQEKFRREAAIKERGQVLCETPHKVPDPSYCGSATRSTL